MDEMAIWKKEFGQHTATEGEVLKGAGTYEAEEAVRDVSASSLWVVENVL